MTNGETGGAPIPVSVVPVVVNRRRAKYDPWYKRTELWVTVGNVAIQLAGIFAHQIPPAYGMGLATLGTVVYAFGRSNVKARLAVSAINAVASELNKKPAGK